MSQKFSFPFSIQLHKQISSRRFIQSDPFDFYSNDELRISYTLPSNSKSLKLKLIGIEELLGDNSAWDATHRNIFYLKEILISRDQIVQGKFSPIHDSFQGEIHILLPSNLQPSLKEEHRRVSYTLRGKAILPDNSMLTISRELKVAGSLVNQYLNKELYKQEYYKKTQSKSFDSGTVTCSLTLEKPIAIIGEEFTVHCNLFNGSSIPIKHLEASLYSRFINEFENESEKQFEKKDENLQPICRIDFGLVDAHSEYHSSKGFFVPEVIESSSVPFGRMGLLIKKEYFVNMHIEAADGQTLMNIQLPVYIVKYDPQLSKNFYESEEAGLLILNRSSDEEKENIVDKSTLSKSIESTELKIPTKHEISKILINNIDNLSNNNFEDQDTYEFVNSDNQGNNSFNSNYNKNTIEINELDIEDNIENKNSNLTNNLLEYERDKAIQQIESQSQNSISLDNQKYTLKSLNHDNTNNNSSDQHLVSEISYETVGRKPNLRGGHNLSEFFTNPPSLGRQSNISDTSIEKHNSPSFINSFSSQNLNQSQNIEDTDTEKEIEEAVRKTREKLLEFQNLFTSFNSKSFQNTSPTSTNSSKSSISSPNNQQSPNNSFNSEKLNDSEKFNVSNRLSASSSRESFINLYPQSRKPRQLNDSIRKKDEIPNNDLNLFKKENTYYDINDSGELYQFDTKNSRSSLEHLEDLPSNLDSQNHIEQEQVEQLEQVVQELVDGSKYVGSIDKSTRLKHGKGTLYYPDGNVYAGDFDHGIRNGWGVFTTKMYTYDGEFKNDYKDGFGAIIYSNGEQYEGQWEKGYPHGKGCYIFADGSKYIGLFSKGLRQGKGVLHYSDGLTCYDGEWINDKKEGKAVVTFPNGKYIGDMRNDMKEGYGKYIYKNGSIYIGEWSNNLKQGKGTFKGHDNSTYTGTWLKGVKEGSGIFVDTNGKTFKEKWKKGRLVSQKLELVSQ